MPWKVGKKMFAENPLPVKHFLTYQNKNTGEQKEYLSPDYPFNDTTWINNWQYISQRVEDPNINIGNNLAISDLEGNDITNIYLKNPDFNFIVVAYDLDEANLKGFRIINNLYFKAEQNDFTFICLTASIPEKIGTFKKNLEISTNFEFFNADDVVLKTMVRSNPGLMLMKNGQVLGKWSFSRLPDWEFLEKNFFNNTSGNQ
jgi:hypothetical protein